MRIDPRNRTRRGKCRQPLTTVKCYQNNPMDLHGPMAYLRLSPQSHDLSNVMNEASQLEPGFVGMNLPDSFSCLEGVNRVRNVHLWKNVWIGDCLSWRTFSSHVRVTFIHQRVEQAEGLHHRQADMVKLAPFLHLWMIFRYLIDWLLQFDCSLCREQIPLFGWCASRSRFSSPDRSRRCPVCSCGTPLPSSRDETCPKDQESTPSATTVNTGVTLH
jgi:hypothetical protein